MKQPYDEIDADPDSPKAEKQQKHWLKLFTNFLETCEHLAQGVAVPGKVRKLTAYVIFRSYLACVDVQFDSFLSIWTWQLWFQTNSCAVTGASEEVRLLTNPVS